MYVHPGSVNFRRLSTNATSTASGSGWICYHSCVKTTKAYLHDSTAIGKYALLLFSSSDMELTEGRGSVVVDGWIKIKMPEKGSVLCKLLRKELEALLARKVRSPATSFADDRAAPLVLDTIRRLLEFDTRA